MKRLGHLQGAKSVMKWIGYVASLGQAPSPLAERRVDRRLQNRELLGKQEWFDRYWRDQGVRQVLSDFIYDHFKDYSGIHFGRVIPADRLHEDLEFPGVCWNDWNSIVFEEFDEVFDINPATILTEEGNTVQSLVSGLERALDKRGR